MGTDDSLSEQSLLYVGASLFSQAIGVPVSVSLFKDLEPSPLFHMTSEKYVHLLIAIGYEFLSSLPAGLFTSLPFSMNCTKPSPPLPISDSTM